MIRGILFFLATLTSAGAYAEVVMESAPSTVARIDVYTRFGNGDITFTLANNSLAAQCPWGFWIRASDAGAKSAFAQITAARYSGQEVTVWVITDVIWEGSSMNTCLLYLVRAD